MSFPLTNMRDIRDCLVSVRVQIFEHNFAESKEKSRRNTVALKDYTHG